MAIVSKDSIVLGMPNQALFIHDGTDVLFEDGEPYDIGSTQQLQFIFRVRRRRGEGERVFLKSFKTLEEFMRFWDRAVGNE